MIFVTAITPFPLVRFFLIAVKAKNQTVFTVQVGTDLFVFKGSLLTAVAMTMFSQMPGGIFYGLVYLRTRSIVAGAIIHTFNDVFAGLLLNS